MVGMVQEKSRTIDCGKDFAFTSYENTLNCGKERKTYEDAFSREGLVGLAEGQLSLGLPHPKQGEVLHLRFFVVLAGLLYLVASFAFAFHDFVLLA